MKTRSERRDKRRYCRFHKEHGHDTEECRDLQSQIDDLIRHGHLCRYVRDQSSLPDSRPPRDPPPRAKGPVKKQIDVIIERSASGGNSSSARKAYARTEKRADAHLRTLAYKKFIARLYDRRVCPRFIRAGDIVLRKAEVSDPTRSHGKLAPNWEGPYRVVDVVQEGTYTLATAKGRVLPRT
ncbi:hypothetical protein B296_00004693 [Ensete ventricosum]|uniref:Reverse transcriptase domain-containing protein n=1 Tax=Ensete ventricosum TaxID=4639 RepID=A0A427B880_ENSVE|nr:hypothetical protein B296_00004693 [Ensete ventricosum]